MMSTPQQKVLIYGTRANPLSFFLSRSLNLRLSATNVFSLDTESTRQQTRLEPARDVYNCNELPDLASQVDLQRIIDQNQITDLIDMTNTSCKQDGELDKLSGLSDSVRLFSPIFTTPLDIRDHKIGNKQLQSPVLPGIVYPFALTQYRFPCDLGTFLFWSRPGPLTKIIELDCKVLNVQNGQDLLELCTARNAATYLTDLVAAPDSDLLTSDGETSCNSSAESSGDDESDEEEDNELRSVTISVDQLCKRLKKINHRFSYQMINDNDEWSPEHATDDLSSVKKQKAFCEQVFKEILLHKEQDLELEAVNQLRTKQSS